MANEIDMLSQFNEMTSKTIDMIRDIMQAIIAEGRSINGEATVAASILSGKESSIISFETKHPDAAVAQAQQANFTDFKQRLRANKIPFISVDIGDYEAKGIIFRDQDKEKVQKITKDINYKYEHFVNDRNR